MTGTTMNVSGSIGYFSNYQSVSRKEEVKSFASTISAKAEETEKTTSQRGTVMADYYEKKPQYKATQEKRVQGGYSVLAAAGLSAEDIENMSDSEFRGVMSKIIQNIPQHPTRPYDEETVLISEEGWENMKKDLDYAAWVLGYLKEDRSVSNPFFAMGDRGCFCVQHFGASPADYQGTGFSKIYGGTAAGARSMYNTAAGSSGIVTRAPQADAQPPKDYNLWEERKKARKKRQEEWLEADIQAKYQQRKRINEMYEKRYYENVAWQKTLNARNLLGNNMDSTAMKPNMTDATMVYEAAGLSAASGFGL